MLRFDRIVDSPLAPDQAARAVRLRLTYDERVKTRLATMTAQGQAVAIMLAEAKRGTVLRHGTVLAGDHDVAIVEAAAQPVARVTADAPLVLLRAVYHLANRHVPAQLALDHVLIERDPVLESMLRGLGAHVEHIEAPFDPEGGAYHAHGAHGDEHAHAAHGHCDEIDAVSATIGEQLSIAAHAKTHAR
jgi:urease accessory protein